MSEQDHNFDHGLVAKNSGFLLNAGGQVVYSLKKPHSDGTTRIVMTKLEFLEKIVATIPRPKIHLTRLLKRVFNFDVEVCADCGGKEKVIAAIEDPVVIRKILTHLGLPTKPLPIRFASGRGPPPENQQDLQDYDYSQETAFDFG